MNLNIPRLEKLPERIKEEDGLYYPEEYRDKIFEYANEILYFKKGTLYNFPLPLFKKIIEISVESSKSLTSEEESEIIVNQVIEKLDEIIERKVEDTVKRVIETYIETVEENVSNKLTDELHNAVSEAIESLKSEIIDMINERFVALETLTKQTANSEGEQKKKLSLKEIFALSETFNAEDLVKLREAGII